MISTFFYELPNLLKFEFVKFTWKFDNLLSHIFSFPSLPYEVKKNNPNFYFSCGTVDIPHGYKNQPDLSYRFPDCCFKLVKLNSTEINANPVVNQNQTHIDNQIQYELHIPVINHSQNDTQ